MDYVLEEMKLNELRKTMELVKRVFDEFEAPYYTKEGVEINKIQNIKFTQIYLYNLKSGLKAIRTF